MDKYHSDTKVKQLEAALDEVCKKADKVVGYYNFGGIRGNPDSLAALGDLAISLQTIKEAKYDK